MTMKSSFLASSFLKRLSVAFLALSVLGVGEASAQGHKRLPRPDQYAPSSVTPGDEQAASAPPLPLPSSLPEGGKPFALGAQHQYVKPETVTIPGSAASTVLNASTNLNDVPAAPLRSQTGLFSQPPGNMFQLKDSRTTLKGNANQQKLKGGAVRVLADYDLELIVDSSLSMRQRDCPDGLSRWEWCGTQTNELAKLLAPFVPKGLTLTSFASQYQVYPNSSPANIAQLFENPGFMWGTRLSLPLSDRLNSFFARRGPGSKPMLIAVITDGVPAPKIEPMLVIEALVEASKQMKDPREITVVFFQIGGSDFKGQRFLAELDHNLANYGARYDFVRTVSFEHLQKVGLAQALVQKIQDFTAAGKPAAKTK
jgi:hypothetical protein